MIRRSFVLVGTVVLCLAACESAGNGGSSGGDSGGGAAESATGTWSGSYEADGVGTRSFEADVEQTGTSLTGQISVPLLELDDAALTGTVAGTEITFGDIDGVVTFTGSIAPDHTAEGTYSAIYDGDSHTGPWDATCVRELVLAAEIELPEVLSMSSGRGVAWDGSGFWLSDHSTLVKVDTDGNVVASFLYDSIIGTLPDHTFGSLCWDGTNLWAVDSEFGDAWDEAIFCVIDTETGEVVRELPCPPDGSSPNSGYVDIAPAWDGSEFWALRESWDEGESIYRIDRAIGTVLEEIAGPEDPLNDGDSFVMAGGFGAVGSNLYFADRQGYLYLLDSSDGQVVRRFTFSRWNGESPEWSGEPGGIAWDGSLLWVRDAFDQRLYAFSLD